MIILIPLGCEGCGLFLYVLQREVREVLDHQHLHTGVLEAIKHKNGEIQEIGVLEGQLGLSPSILRLYPFTCDVVYIGQIWFGEHMLIEALMSRPIQSGLGLPPVHAVYSSLEDRNKPPIMGVVSQMMVVADGEAEGEACWGATPGEGPEGGPEGG